MAGPVTTTLLSPNPASGTTTTDGTEQTLASGTASGTFVLKLDMNAQADGDEFELRGYTKALESGTDRMAWYARLGPVAPGTNSNLIVISPAIATAGDIKFTIKRVAGSDRAIPWGVLNLNGT